MNEEFEKIYNEYIKEEKEYLEEEGFRKNEAGVHIYVSVDGSHSINLPAILKDYVEYLIDKKVIKYRY